MRPTRRARGRIRAVPERSLGETMLHSPALRQSGGMIIALRVMYVARGYVQTRLIMRSWGSSTTLSVDDA